MFLGEFQHSLDAKGRVILPVRFRDQLEGGAVMARALDGCLAVYPLSEFDRLSHKLQEVRERGPRERQAARSFAFVCCNISVAALSEGLSLIACW